MKTDHTQGEVAQRTANEVPSPIGNASERKAGAGLAAAHGSVDISKLPTEFRGCMWNDGWEFEAPCVIYYPRKLMRYAHGGNTGTLDDLVQDITYNLGEGLPPNDGGLDDDCKWRGWSKDGMRRRRDAWHVVFKGVWVNTEDGPEWKQTSRTETYGIPQNVKLCEEGGK